MIVLAPTVVRCVCPVERGPLTGKPPNREKLSATLRGVEVWGGICWVFSSTENTQSRSRIAMFWRSLVEEGTWVLLETELYWVVCHSCPWLDAADTSPRQFTTSLWQHAACIRKCLCLHLLALSWAPASLSQASGMLGQQSLQSTLNHLQIDSLIPESQPITTHTKKPCSHCVCCQGVDIKIRHKQFED